MTTRHRNALRLWLAGIALLIVAMILVGGATRLTNSGLSITEWQPIMGAVPPLSASDWDKAFAAYQKIPEYTELKRGMSLDEFKTIYWWEWTHRFLGRLIGIVFFVPFVAFWAAGYIPRTLLPRLAGLFVLGRPARRRRLVHGEERPRRPDRCEPIPARRPSRHRRADLGLYAVASVRARQRSGAMAAHRPALARRTHGRRRDPPADLSANSGGRARGGHRRGPGLQHLAADQWRLYPRGAWRAVTLDAQSVREPAHGAVRPPHARLHRPAREPRPSRLARLQQAARKPWSRAGWRFSASSCCKPRSACGRYCSPCPFLWVLPIRRARSSSSPPRSIIFGSRPAVPAVARVQAATSA